MEANQIYRCSVCLVEINTRAANALTGAGGFGYGTCSQECARTVHLSEAIGNAIRSLSQSIEWLKNSNL